LRAFPNLSLDPKDYELAADYFNMCRRNGIQGANTDFLICATASKRNYEIFTTDKDFISFSQHLPIVLTNL
jgi:predicted nucleic acid-binding protein